MSVLKTVLIILFVIDSVFLVIAVLLQSGRGTGLAGALGGIGAPDSALGVRAASQIEKATGILAVIFFVIALTLGFISSENTKGPEAKVTTRAVGPVWFTTQPAELIPTTPPAGAETSPPAAVTSPPAGTTPPAAAETPPATAPASGR